MEKSNVHLYDGWSICAVSIKNDSMAFCVFEILHEILEKKPMTPCPYRNLSGWCNWASAKYVWYAHEIGNYIYW